MSNYFFSSIFIHFIIHFHPFSYKSLYILILYWDVIHLHNIPFQFIFIFLEYCCCPLIISSRYTRYLDSLFTFLLLLPNLNYIFHIYSVIFCQSWVCTFLPHSSLLKCQGKHSYYNKYMTQQVKCYNNMTIQLNFSSQSELNNPQGLWAFSGLYGTGRWGGNLSKRITLLAL